MIRWNKCKMLSGQELAGTNLSKANLPGCIMALSDQTQQLQYLQQCKGYLQDGLSNLSFPAYNYKPIARNTLSLLVSTFPANAKTALPFLHEAEKALGFKLTQVYTIAPNIYRFRHSPKWTEYPTLSSMFQMIIRGCFGSKATKLADVTTPALAKDNAEWPLAHAAMLRIMAGETKYKLNTWAKPRNGSHMNSIYYYGVHYETWN